MLNRIVYGIYNDEEVLLKAVRALREKEIKIAEIFTPFPVHGLDKAAGVPKTRMAIVSFLFGIAGLSFGLWMTWYMLIEDWPLNIGGKPNFSFHQNVPAFVPVLFELSVFCAAHGMVLTFFFRSRLIPGRKSTNPFPETTNDKFAIEIDSNVNFSRDELHLILNKTGVFEIKELDKRN
jgi:hypothetical protein